MKCYDRYYSVGFMADSINPIVRWRMYTRLPGEMPRRVQEEV